jgi:uncharacterized membrane protein
MHIEAFYMSFNTTTGCNLYLIIKNMSKMILAAFKDTDDAEKAINQLQENGYNPKDISIVMKDKESSKEMVDRTGVNEEAVAAGATTGALTGGAIGALTGLLVGIGALAIPGLGALLVAGPIATALGLGGTVAGSTISGGTLGALTGGLVGALTGLGVPEEDAKRYEETVKQGGVLVAVPADENNEELSSVLQNHHADQIRTIDVKS